MCVCVCVCVCVCTLGIRISSRCFPTDGIARTASVYFQMVMHHYVSTISKLDIQWMSFHWSVNNFVSHSVEHVGFCVKKTCICGEFYCTTLFKRNLPLKHSEFLLSLTATMFCRKQRAEFGLAPSKIIILILTIKKHSGAPKKFEDKN